jgi:hypothetical protein
VQLVGDYIPCKPTRSVAANNQSGFDDPGFTENALNYCFAAISKSQSEPTLLEIALEQIPPR